jgi:hypothetical protein
VILHPGAFRGCLQIPNPASQRKTEADFVPPALRMVYKGARARLLQPEHLPHLSIVSGSSPPDKAVRALATVCTLGASVIAYWLNKDGKMGKACVKACPTESLSVHDVPIIRIFPERMPLRGFERTKSAARVLLIRGDPFVSSKSRLPGPRLQNAGLISSLTGLTERVPTSWRSSMDKSSPHQFTLFVHFPLMPK